MNIRRYILALLLAPGIILADPLPQPKTAEIVAVPAKYAQDGIKAGDVRIIYTDGHTEILTKSGNCKDAKVAANGMVGWVHFRSLDRRNYPLDEMLHLRLLNGSVKQFKPYRTAPFIMNWGLVENGRSLAIESMQHHGPPFYISYDIATGRVLGTVDHYTPYEQLPSWAQAVSDDKP